VLCCFVGQYELVGHRRRVSPAGIRVHVVVVRVTCCTIVCIPAKTQPFLFARRNNLHIVDLESRRKKLDILKSTWDVCDKNHTALS
jgi:hypothetical protein